MNTNDPKFTAHVLGEMDDLTPAERAEIAALLAADSEAATEAEETRALATRLRCELQTEQAAPLTEAQRAAVLSANSADGAANDAHSDNIVIAPISAHRRWLAGLALAASVAVCATFAWKTEFQKPISPAENLVFTEQSSVENLQDVKVATAPHSESGLPVLKPQENAVLGAIASEKPRLMDADEPPATVPPISAPATAVSADALPVEAKKESRMANEPGDSAGSKAADNQKQLLTEAKGFADGGRLDLAFKRFEQVLSIDPYNKEARAGEEAVARAKSDFDIAAYNETRARAVPKVEAAWANPVRRFDHLSPASPASSGSARGAAAAGNLVKADSTDRYYESVAESVRLQRDDGTESRPEARQRVGRMNLSASAESESAESYDFLPDNGFLTVAQAPLSTFSIDVDTASYAIVRRFLNEQKLPPKGAVRIEELINYFSYDYPQPQGDAPFSATMEVAACPWTPEHRLVRIGLKGHEIAKDKRPPSNLVFLIDVSGSMQPANKLPLLKQSLGLLIDQLGAEDQVAMVVYAGSSGTVLEPTRSKAKMRAALAKLEAGGSTNGASGVQLAYELAEKGFIKSGTNRVILATDGDWNVGVTNPAELFELITKKAKSGVFLTVLGYGMDNLKDSMLVKLANKGNGNYGYIDTLIEAKKLLADELSSTLVTIAKDVKIQVEFNPAQVAAYRLIGYEKRLLAKEDFNDDTKDAGEIGAGHTVTALYEVVPDGRALPPEFARVDELKYQRTAPAEKPETRNQKPETSPELLTLKLRYKAPEGDASKLLEFPLTDSGATLEKSSRDFRFAAAVAGYGMLLRNSPHKGSATWDSVRELAVEGQGEDRTGYRAEFITLLEKARALVR